MSFTGFGEIADLATTVINKLFPDKAAEEKDKMAFEMQKLLLEAQTSQAQTDVNKIEAASTNIFVAGWRPFVGWVCGTGFGIQVLGPLLQWVSSLAGHPVIFPALDTGLMTSTLAALLGLGGMRSWEKIQGVNSGH
jgi:hypothetical protein